MPSEPVGASTGAPIRRGRNRWYNNWKILVPVVLGALILLLGLFVFGVLSVVYSIFRNSEPYAAAVRSANQSRAVALEIGTPVHVGWWMTGNINYQNADGDADLGIPISGPKGRGRIVVVAKKRAGHWTYQTLEVDVDGEIAPIKLSNPDAAPAPPNPAPAAPAGSV